MIAQHLLENKHLIKSMEDIMEVLKIIRKGSIIDTSVNFHIHIIKQNLTIETKINERQNIT
jgi:hypothetical protein